MPVAEHHELDVERGQPHSAHVVTQAIGGHARVEEQVMVMAGAAHGDQHGKPMLSQGNIVSFAGVEHIGRQPLRRGGGEQAVPVHRTLIR